MTSLYLFNSALQEPCLRELDTLAIVFFKGDNGCYFLFVFQHSNVNKWTQELIQAEPHQVLNMKGKDRQIQLNSYKKNRWQANLATFSRKNTCIIVERTTFIVKHYRTFNKKYHNEIAALERSVIIYLDVCVCGGGGGGALAKFTGLNASPSASIVVKSISFFGGLSGKCRLLKESLKAKCYVLE